ncbi:hypothetical protein KKA93_00510 [Patescibacteria group bacterium]|nr:hypothetical protein [Patescibacteria group bacterium]MBU1663277.1 hypothetical protein [Patescibacteria group bacterium]MBU1933871.1 hypothetical protein [Patescibacteria group bacterium]MBU2007956.1 hypothetical protein [Patescibacteria group bacterium]MBU2233570.1 hypothetical protein [Patescibacteria group bacterium]
MPIAVIAIAGSIIAWFMGANIASLTLFAIVGGLASFLSWVIGVISTVLTYILFQILPYNDFINEAVVRNGWVMVRDICNMFFILILLIIAFAAILRIESYQWKKTLPKLLIMAILINFSKTICGLVIDFSQVIMLTFVNAFSSSGSGSLYYLFGLQNLFSIKTFINAASTKTNVDTNTGFAVAGSLVLGLILIIIATIVIAIYTIILIYRIIMLWILIILSPLAFLAMAIPAGAKYASQWIGEFTKYVIIGPVMAFFLWLALTMSTTSIPIDYQYSTNKSGGANIGEPTAPPGTGSVASEPANMKQFIVATLFLMASLMMAQQIGAAGSSLAGGAVNKIKGAGVAIAGFGLSKVGQNLDQAQMWGQSKIAQRVSLATKGKLGANYQAKSLNYRMIKEGFIRDQAIKMRKYEGTKAGAWQDQFNRTTSASIGIPVVSQIMKNRVAKRAKAHEDDIKNEQKLKEEYEKKLKNTPVTDTAKQQELTINIKASEEKIKESKIKMNDEIKKAQTAWTLGKLPPQRYMRLQEQEKVNEARARITKEEDLSEDNLVHNAIAAEATGDKTDMRAYISLLADTNGLNTYFDTIKKDLTSASIKEVFEEKFGNAAGDVLTDVSRRAEAVGNSKFMGLHKFDIAQNRNRVADVDEQSKYNEKKDDAKYAQIHARTTHFDSLYDKTEAGGCTLSDNGFMQLGHIGASRGRMQEIKNGNYQPRYGAMVIKLEGDIKIKAEELEKSGRKKEAESLLSVLKAFKENYSLSGKLDKLDKEDSVASEQGKGDDRVLYDG